MSDKIEILIAGRLAPALVEDEIITEAKYIEFDNGDGIKQTVEAVLQELKTAGSTGTPGTPGDGGNFTETDPSVPEWVKASKEGGYGNDFPGAKYFGAHTDDEIKSIVNSEFGSFHGNGPIRTIYELIITDVNDTENWNVREGEGDDGKDFYEIKRLRNDAVLGVYSVVTDEKGEKKVGSELYTQKRCEGEYIYLGLGSDLANEYFVCKLSGSDSDMKNAVLYKTVPTADNINVGVDSGDNTTNYHSYVDMNIAGKTIRFLWGYKVHGSGNRNGDIYFPMGGFKKLHYVTLTASMMKFNKPADPGFYMCHYDPSFYGLGEDGKEISTKKIGYRVSQDYSFRLYYFAIGEV